MWPVQIRTHIFPGLAPLKSNRLFPLQYDYKIEFGPRRLDPEPHGIQLARGPAAVAVTRASADRAATWQVSHDLLNWLQVRKLH